MVAALLQGVEVAAGRGVCARGDGVGHGMPGQGQSELFDVWPLAGRSVLGPSAASMNSASGAPNSVANLSSTVTSVKPSSPGSTCASQLMDLCISRASRSRDRLRSTRYW